MVRYNVRLPKFEAIMMRVGDLVDLFMQWYNYDRAHMSLDWNNQERSVQAFKREMPKSGETVIVRQERNILADKGQLLLGYHI